MLCYYAYLQLQPYALSVSNLVKYCKIDTKKQGKSVIEQKIYRKGFEKLFEDSIDHRSLFEQYGLQNLKNRSYVGFKTYNAINATLSIFRNQFLQATDGFYRTMDEMLRMIGKTETLNIDVVKDVS